MNKLRRSRFAKFIAGISIIVYAAAVVFNILGTWFLMDENLYYASRDQLQQKLYSYIYDYTASDLMRYLNTTESIYSNNDSYKNYHQSEIELYRSKYSQENSNIHFRITDEKGYELLKNDYITETPCFSFSSVFITDITFDNDWYVQGGSDQMGIYNEIVTETTTFRQDETESTPYSAEFTEDNSEIAIVNEKTANDSISETTLDTSGYKTEEIAVSNINSDNVTALHYFYKDEINFKILYYCKDIVKNLNYDITEITFYQDDFTVDDDFRDEDYYEVNQVYGILDEAVPLKSFSTVLITNGKEAVINYSYNGSFYEDEFSNRLSLASLIVNNSNEEKINLEYYQKSRIQLNVEILVPYNCYRNDIYGFAENAVDIAMVYMDNIILITVFDFFVFLFAIIYLLWSAGYVPNKDKPAARGLHAIPFDLYAFLSVLAAVGCFAMIDTTDEVLALFGFIGWALLLICFIYTVFVRLRASSLKRNTLCYRFYSVLKNAASTMNEATGSKIKILITVAVFVVFAAFEIIFFMMFNCFEAATFTLLIKFLELPFIVLTLIALIALQNGARAISKGDISYRVSSPLLIGPLKKHADYLNSINDAVEDAVEERLKSESLKTELITNVSHDLKTPLTSIVNYVDLLKMEKVYNPKAEEYIDVIDRQAQRLKKLTVDIVEASKAATGNITVNYENTALNVILLQTNGEYIERLEEKSLTLVQEIPDNDIFVSTDGRLLWRVIDNIMNNICKYSMPGTRVYLTLWENNGKAFISFRNISKFKLNVSPDSLTERFVRGDTSRNTEGSGLGLSIANSLTEIMGGRLSIIIDGDLFKVTLCFPTVIPEKDSNDSEITEL